MAAEEVRVLITADVVDVTVRTSGVLFLFGVFLVALVQLSRWCCHGAVKKQIADDADVQVEITADEKTEESTENEVKDAATTRTTVVDLEALPRRLLLESMLRDELRNAVRRRGLPVTGLKPDLVNKLMSGPGAECLSNEACIAMRFVHRRSGSKAPEGFALEDDAAAFAWIQRTLMESPSWGGQAAAEGLRRRAARP